MCGTEVRSSPCPQGAHSLSGEDSTCSESSSESNIVIEVCTGPVSPGWARPNSVRKATLGHRASELQFSRQWEVLPGARKGTDIAQDTDFSTEQELYGIWYSVWLARRPLRQPRSYSIGNWGRMKGLCLWQNCLLPPCSEKAHRLQDAVLVPDKPWGVTFTHQDACILCNLMMQTASSSSDPFPEKKNMAKSPFSQNK